MNDNSLMGRGAQSTINFGNSLDALKENLRSRGYKTAGERKAEEAAKTQESDETEKVASELGNKLLRDIGASLVKRGGGPVKSSNPLQRFTNRAYSPGKNTEAKTEEPKVEEVKEEVKEEPKEDDGETIEYTYKAGDTFGQVIKDLGLESGNGLWGNNGDVNYYTQQLIDQGLWGNGMAGNIPIGTTIRLKKRQLTPEMQAYRQKYGYN